MTDAERRQRIAEVLREIDEALAFPDVSGARMAGRAAFAQLVHLRDLFDSVVLLLDRARGHGAFVLGRSMFETSLMLGALEDAMAREATVLRWFQDSNNRSHRLIRGLAAAGVAVDFREHERLLADSNRKLASACVEHGIKKLPARLNIENEAKRQSRDEDVANYIHAHEFTHGGYNALRFRITHHETEERSTFHVNQAHNLELLEAAANFAGRSALLGFRSGYRIFELPEPEAFPGLLELIEFENEGDDFEIVE